jgi:tRNA threonylcarbamoyladenosine modification (KEOPS) complex  Pcc1 subunit
MTAVQLYYNTICGSASVLEVNVDSDASRVYRAWAVDLNQQPSQRVSAVLGPTL